MFNQFNQRRQFTPSTPARPLPGQSVGPTNNSGSFSHQIRPDFARQAKPSSTGQMRQTQTNDITAARMTRTQADSFQRLSPQSQRAALFDQARQQNQQMHQMNYQAMRDPGAMLPGGLSERQRADFQMLQRSNPAAAQQQLLQYQRNADIRYNKPAPNAGGLPPAGPTYRRPPSNQNGPRRSFGS